MRTGYHGYDRGNQTVALFKGGAPKIPNEFSYLEQFTVLDV